MITFIKRLLGLKKGDNLDPETQVDFEVKDIQKNYILDYDFTSWQVQDKAVYTWDNGVKDLEFTIFDGQKKLYLNYESIDQKTSVYWDVNIDEVWNQFKTFIRKDVEMDDKTFGYKGQTYHFHGEGTARVKGSSETYNMQNWLFLSNGGEFLISFNKYDDRSFDAYQGKYIKDHEISNILPKK
jgi:hypothetical protein